MLDETTRAAFRNMKYMPFPKRSLPPEPLTPDDVGRLIDKKDKLK